VIADKIDLVMWTKNGARTLPCVLLQIERVIPKSVIANKIIVDDSSSDDTAQIARRYDWTVHSNDGKGISDGANTALKLVESEIFASFEQDILLSPYWWPKVPKLLIEKDTAVASGSRFPSQPMALRRLLEYDLETYSRDSEDRDFFHFAKTLDNTIYKTEMLRKIGGFPQITLDACVDNVLAKRLYDSGFKWKVEYGVRSLHLRKGLLDELRHFEWYGEQYPFLLPYLFGKHAVARDFLKRFIFSPKTALSFALKMDEAQLIYIIPLIRLALYKGFISGAKKVAKTRAIKTFI
jgi:glycosyltransferase involved in cell wall biosynthesis